MRPPPPRGAVSLQPPFSCDEFQAVKGGLGFIIRPSPSLCPTCAASMAELDVQLSHVLPATTMPSAVEPVRMSCTLGVGEPDHCPGTLAPFSSRNRSALPLGNMCSAARFAASIWPLMLCQ